MKKTLLVSGIAFVGALLLLYLVGALPFQPRQTLWTFSEQYAEGRAPVLEWRFAAPGPLPTVVQPDWTPDLRYPSRLLLVLPSTPTLQAIVLSRNLPLRYRAIDFTREVGRATSFALRFEGRHAVLKGISLYQASEPPPSVWPFVLVLILLVFFLPGGRDSRILLLIVGVGFVLRWHEFVNYFSVPLAGDAAEYGYLTHHVQWSHPFQTGSREPLFIWVMKAGTALFGDSERSLRLVALLASCGCIVLICRLLTAFGWPHGVGWVAGAVYAFNPFAIFMSVQGYQLEVYTFLVLALVWVWQLHKPLATGLLAGALCLTRVQFVFSVLPLFALAAWRFSWRKREMLRCLLPFLILITPYFFITRARTGSFFGQLHQHASYYQAADKLGDPLRANELPRITAWQLLFANQSIPSLIRKTLGGYAEIFFNPANPYNRIFLNSHYARPWNGFFLPFFWIGLGVCIRRKEGRWLLAAGLLFLNILPFLHDLFREPRLLFHAAPWVAMMVAVGVGAVVQFRPRKFFQAR